MLQASSERPASAAGMWVPGMSPQAAAEAGAARLWVPGVTPQAAGSARAREIAQRREEMLGMLHGLPEADYELSLTDLVEKTANGAAAGGNGETKEAAPSPRPLAPPPPTETKEATPTPSPPLGPPAEQQQPAPVPRTERKGSARRGGRSFRSSSDGVLLNFYMPRSLTRSFTAPRAARAQPVVHCARPAASVVVVSDDRNKRERDGDTVRCWPLPWDRRWRKSSRRDLTSPPTGESAVLEAAKHSAPPAKT
ncbi:uncharacterized protein LOC100837350 [Brachypodium distachyon]|uniref:Uncharacterized protein n=1 Tax=Brachypodium distachyon TaxID=15368 RepID=A0A0Q3LKR3_BRADI|nr:uncharacterized protein LOC100837350 [Brachypodium distachyon]KQK23889.1 hypothetical protein BRADI_1g76810v3 [Brachypodium distachyon]|eukprot:XP_003562160.1 uncharacterized protein LOC100837350 [Brachypodium distachyon]